MGVSATPGEVFPAAGTGASALVVLRLFASARQAAGTGRAELRAATVGDALGQARRRYGDAFSQVLDSSRVWVNGSPAGEADRLDDGDEVAVLPPVSGGATAIPR